MASPQKSRKSLEGLFPGLIINKASTSIEGSIASKRTMKDSLRQTLSGAAGAWPSWLKSHKDGQGLPVVLTMRLEDYLREEFRKHNLESDPVDIIRGSRNASAASKVGEVSDKIFERIEDESCRVIFGSNLIENAGAGFDYTINLCRRIFRGEHIDAAAVDERTPEYAQLLQNLKQRGQEANLPAVIRTRREIIQHAQALSWAIDNMVLSVKPWTEEAVKKIHSLLYSGMANDEVVPGEYRGVDHPCAARYTDPKTGKEKVTKFVHPRAVPSYMVAWVDNLNKDVERVESGASFDPYDLATQHYHHFINIHPFGDGNGRTSRIILNCLVMKFTGHLIPVGEDSKERDEFLAIAVRGSKEYYKEDDVVEMSEQKGHREMTKLVARKSVKPLTSMWTWAKKHISK